MNIKNFIILLINLSLTEWFVLAQVCTNYPYKPGPNPTPSLPNKYSVRVEIKQVEDQKTVEMRANYDYSKKKASLEIRENSVIKKLIYNYETDEIFSLVSVPNTESLLTPPPDFKPLYPTTCETFQLSTNLPLNYYFGFTGFSGNYMPSSASTFFRFNPQAYDGEDTVRGIPCDVYVSCQYNPATMANYTIRHFFSKSSYTLPGSNQTFSRLPVRATYSGSALKPDGTNKPFTNVYDFYDFRLNTERDDVFQTPGGVFCTNRKLTSKKPPKIKGSFRFSEEITSKGVTSHITDLIYDEDLQIISYETRNKFTNDSDTSLFSKDPILYVNDYTIGVSYQTNLNTGKCLISNIETYAFAVDRNFTQSLLDSGNGYAIRLKTPSSLLELDLDYVYTGQRIIDGLPSDIYISKVDLSKNLSTINEYAFSTNDFNIMNNGLLVNNIPKRLAKTSPQSDFESVSTIYNFNPFQSNINQFDVSNCYDDSTLIQFRILFKPKTDIDLLILRRTDLNRYLKRAIYAGIGQLTGELSIRFAIPRLSLNDNGTLIVRSAVLPGPEPLVLFKRFPSKLLTNTQFTTQSNINSTEGCAIKCLDSKNCLSFDYSNTSRICYLNAKHFTNGTFSNFSSYDHYSRNSLNYVKFAPKYVVWSDLQRLINSFALLIPVTDMMNQNFTVSIRGEFIEEVKNNENRFGTTSLLSRYNLKKPNFKFSSNKDQLLTSISIDDCAKKCTDEIGIVCKSFHFCYLSGECVISKETLSSNSSNYVSNDHCDIYEKDALIHYNLFRTKATINPKDKKFTDIKDPSDCAEKCDNELKINCKSFNFCPNTNECYLSEKHLVDGSGSASSDLICDHYSRKYIQDFTYINTAKIKLSAEVVLKESSLDICSRECVNTDGFNCKSFDFCPESNTCLLNSGQQQQAANIPDAPIESCAHYRREYFFVTSAYTPKSSDSSTSTLTTLAIVFALLSSAVGGVGTVFLLKKFGK